MVKVFIAGAHGYIGYPVAQALTRAGHKVYGLARNLDVARELQSNEITPIVGDAMIPRAWISAVANVDVVIDAIGGKDVSTACTTLFQAFNQEVRRLRPNGPPLTYIYTSGTLVFGDNPNIVFNDFTPVTTGVPQIAWRIPHERVVTGTKTAFIQGIVIRPGLVYGRDCAFVGRSTFAPASTGLVQWFGQRGSRTPTIHQDDLAGLFVKVVEKAPILGGLAIVGANPESESWDFILSQLCKVVRVKEIAYVPPGNNGEAAMALSQEFNACLAKDLLDWVPKKRTFGDGLADYYAAWQASQGQVNVLGAGPQ